MSRDKGQGIRDRIAAGRQRLIEAGFREADAAIDADVLARHVLGWDLARLLAHGDAPAPPGFDQAFDTAIARRTKREPVAFIVGRREFWGLDFELTRATLVPRPETEIIVEEALRLLPADSRALVLDVGTGSGCMGVSLAVERPNVRVIATDLSHDALLVARRNAHTHGAGGRMRFVCADLVAGIRARADLIVSNPPYVPLRSKPGVSPDVLLYEPETALFGGDDGLTIIHRLLATAGGCLAPDGTLIFEFGLGQEDEVRGLAVAAGWQVPAVLHDLQGIARTIVLRR